MGILDDLAMGFGLKEKTQDYYDRTEQTLRRTQGDDRGDIYARQTASRRANAPNYSNPIGPLRPGDAPLRQSMFQRNDPRDRSSSTFRNPQAGTIQSFFGGGSRLGDQPMTPGRFLTNFIPGVGLFRGLQRASGNQPYTMNMQSGTGTYDPNKVNAMIAAAQTPQSANPGSMSRAAASDPRVAAATMQAAPAAQTGATYSGLPLAMEAQYSTSPAPLLATPDIGPLFPKNTFGEVVLDPNAEALTGQPSDPRYMPGGEFDAFMEQTGSLPAFDPYRNDRKKMMEIFEEYLKTQGSDS